MFSLTLALMLVAAEAPATTPAPAAAKPAKEKKICRNAERTGSRMSKRICKTADEWANLDNSGAAKTELLNKEFKQGTAP